MHKKLYSNTQLVCQLQTKKQLPETECLNGVISLTKNGVLFQETIPRKRENRNGKLYEGTHVSIVRRKDGLYYPLLKAIKPTEDLDRSSLAFSIYSEISEALNHIE
ncbi:MAG: hypothetical protein J5735_05270 [Prevotella sp.]|nr:hypothetical protein [Prevotella sp.]